MSSKPRDDDDRSVNYPCPSYSRDTTDRAMKNARHTRQPPSRPWYVSDELVDHYVKAGRLGGSLQMSKYLRFIRSTLVNTGIIAIAILSLIQGGNASVIGPIALVSLAGYNGVELADYASLAQAITELNNSDGDGGGN